MKKNELKMFFDLVVEYQYFNINVEKVISKEGDGIILNGREYPYFRFISISCNGEDIDAFAEKIRKQTKKTIHYMRKLYAKHGKKAKFFLGDYDIDMQYLTIYPEWSVKKTESVWIIRAQNKQPYTGESPLPEEFFNYINECTEIIQRSIDKIQAEYDYLNKLFKRPKEKNKKKIINDPF